MLTLSLFYVAAWGGLVISSQAITSDRLMRLTLARRASITKLGRERLRVLGRYLSRNDVTS
jgi:hypothetical protein